ncbi:MAG: YlxR family protein [Synergistaceae bacterium]|jgi:hypothetical protein|nr:YlxR family protein [Synergistaceae bacterium]
MGDSAKGVTKRKRPRTCVGCGQESPKRGLIRVVRDPEGQVRVDPTGRAPGRGAYLCRDRECLERARKKNALARCLRVDVPAEVYDVLLKFIERESP